MYHLTFLILDGSEPAAVPIPTIGREKLGKTM
jgi:hypothetical protein